jgi:lysophospholipase L1-like esterase
MAACKPNLEPETPSAGNADFTRYVAVGNSLTAGFSNNSLYRSGQQNSYPALLAKQFQTAGGGEFRIPLLPGEFGYPNGKLVLEMKKPICSDEPATLTPIVFPGAIDSAGSAASIAGTAYHNLGIPGIRAIDMLFPGYAALNPYARRIFSNLTTRPLDEITKLKPTFFTLWLGNNDVLGYATGGGEGSNTGISDVAFFRAAYDSVITKLTQNGAKGVVMNIPDITTIPFFTTIPTNGLTLTKLEADQLNNQYKIANIPIRFEEGKNRFVIADPDQPTGVRQIFEDELVLLSLPQDSVRCLKWGSAVPIPARYILSRNEVNKARSAVSTFNSIIAELATSKNIPVVDMNAYMKTLQSGISYNGVTYGATFVSGGVFSLDGVHPTEKGYALITNHILQTINNYYRAKLPMVDPNEYQGIKLP